ncbi:MAG: hypothetical protein M3R17_17925 [Bacteroidota bacterium]|nr:hypothetical protein [Bacteroidota bacterium]
MVQVIGWQKRQKENGESFNVLNLQGGIEMIKSSKTGKFYATAKKTNLVCTFNEVMCASMVGQKLPGTIDKMNCDPYEYTIPNSTEKIKLTHTYFYNPEAVGVEDHVFGE